MPTKSAIILAILIMPVKRRRKNPTLPPFARSIVRRSMPPTSLPMTCSNFRSEDSLKGYQPDILDLTKVRPINHFSGFHTFYPTFSSGAGGAPFKTVLDYDNALKRHAGYVVLLDRSIERFKEGEAAGVFETKMTIRNVIEQLDTQLKQPVEESPFYGPIKKFPADFSEADKARPPLPTRRRSSTTFIRR